MLTVYNEYGPEGQTKKIVAHGVNEIEVKNSDGCWLMYMPVTDFGSDYELTLDSTGSVELNVFFPQETFGPRQWNRFIMDTQAEVHLTFCTHMEWEEDMIEPLKPKGVSHLYFRRKDKKPTSDEDVSFEWVMSSGEE